MDQAASWPGLSTLIKPAGGSRPLGIVIEELISQGSQMTEVTEVPSSVIKEAVEREARDDGRRHLHLHQ